MLTAIPSKATNKIYVGNLSWGTESADLRAHFEEYGSIKQIQIMKDKYTKRSRGFGFVTFDSEASAEAAVASNKKEVNKRTLRVVLAIKKHGTEAEAEPDLVIKHCPKKVNQKPKIEKEAVVDFVLKLTTQKPETDLVLKLDNAEKGKKAKTKTRAKQPKYITWTPEEELVWGEMIIKRYGEITELDRKLHFSLSSPKKVMTDDEFKLGMRRRVGIEPY
jgi:RNA recognition motif-containing protein